MATNSETRQIEIILKGQQATSSIKEMGAAAAVMKAQLDKMSQDDPRREKLQRDYAEMSGRLREANVAARTLVKTTEELAAEQEAANAEALRVVVNGKKVAATYNEMDAAAKQLEKDIKDLTPGTAEFIKKSKDLQEVRGRMEEVDKSVKGTEKSTWAAKLGFDGITSASGLMKAGFQAAMAALLPLLAVEKVMELVKAFISLINEVDEVESAINTATGAQGAMLDTLYAKVQALSRTFGDEYADVLKAADVLAKQMGISHEEAFAVIEKGYLAGANRSGEMIDQIKEYSVQMKAAGFTAEEFVAHLANAEMGGVFSDKGVDAVKEFGLRIKEQTTATRDAMDGAFGQAFTNRIFKGINDGSMTVKQAMAEVGKAMQDTTIPASKLQTVVADVWGGPGEDAGTAYLQSLGNMAKGLDGLIDKSSVYTQRLQEQMSAEELLADSENYLTQQFNGSGTALNNLWTTVRTYVYYGIGNFIQSMKQLGYEFVAGGEYMRSWGNTVATIFSALVNRDWAAAKAAFSQGGAASAKAYSDSYKKSMAENEAAMAAATQKTSGAGPTVPGDVKTGGSSRQDDEKEQKAANKRAEQEAKHHAAELKKAREDAAKARVEADRNAEDLAVALIKDKHEREIQEINLQTNRKMEALKGDDEQIMAQWELLEQQRQEKIAAVRLAQKEAAETTRKDELDKQVEEEQLLEEEQAAKVELALANGLLTQQAYEDALYTLRRVSMENQLALIREKAGEESAEYRRLHAKKEADEAVHIAKKNKLKDEESKFEKAIHLVSKSIGADELEFFGEILGKKTVAYKAFQAIKKAAALAEIGINLQSELQSHAKQSAEYPFPLNLAYLAGMSTMSIVRAGVAGAKIAAFAKGGKTTEGKDMLSTNTVLTLLSGASGGSQAPNGSFAGGGPVGQATIGLIGEAGPELVIPNWMYADPKQADLMGFLEATIARRGNAFAEGGSTVAGFTAKSSTGEGESVTGILAQMVQVLGQLDGRLEGVEDWQRNLSVQNNLQEVFDGLKTVQKTKEGGGIR